MLQAGISMIAQTPQWGTGRQAQPENQELELAAC
jgi:hypothetical protein